MRPGLKSSIFGDKMIELGKFSAIKTKLNQIDRISVSQ